jgi:hypothetical protein
MSQGLSVSMNRQTSLMRKSKDTYINFYNAESESSSEDEDMYRSDLDSDEDQDDAGPINLKDIGIYSGEKSCRD